MNPEHQQIDEKQRTEPRRPRLCLRAWPPLLAAIGFLLGYTAQAQSTIFWSTPVAIVGDSDVATTGSLVYAYTESGAGATVNGVSFAAGNSATSLGGNVTMTGLDSVDPVSFIGGNPIGLSSAYQTVIKGGAWNNGASATITLNNLTSGRPYLVQFWVADYRPVGNYNRSETLSAGNTSGALAYLRNGGASSGTHVTGTFTASGTSQTIVLSPNASAQMNAIQVRDLTSYTVSYNGNSPTSGSAPTDGSSPYDAGSTVTVLGNTGNLAKTGKIFGGWNTRANGTGTTYPAGSNFTITRNMVLYARWVNGYSVAYDANGGVNPPVDTTVYSSGATVTVRNVGSMTRPGFTFTGWNTAADGSGTAYSVGSTFSIATSTNLYARWTLSAAVWNNSAGTGNWNTTDANWTGQAWNSGANADFPSVGGMIHLTQPITAGSVNVGNSSSNISNITFTNGSLTAASLTVQGNGLNGGGYDTNPNLTLDVPTVSLSGDLAAGRATLVIASGSVTVNRIISAASSADWGAVKINGGTVTATNGVDGSVNTPFTFQLELNGGTLRTPSIRVADREFGTNNNSWLALNGGTLQATADNPDFITLYGGNQNAYVGNGGAIFDTDGHDIGIDVNLLANGDGGLTKSGAGTLTLSGHNSYLGTTRVAAGVLSLASSAAMPAASSVEIASGAMMHLGFSGSLPVRSLRLNGVTQSQGIYSATTHPGYFTGTGQLVVPPPFTNALADASTDGISNFRRMKYGFFAHYVWGGSSYTVTVNSDGSKPAGLDDLANRFDAPRFADDLARMQVEYVIFTAWHANINCLWPSAAMDRWLTGHTSRRDVLGDMIDAVKARGIRVLLYTHPRDGHDLSQPDQVATGWGGPGAGADPDWNLFDREKWNDFTNELYGELVERYGSRIDGLYLDEGSAAGDSYRVVDYPRLRQTIKSRNPDLLMIQNNYGNLYSCDVGDQEIYGGHYGGPYDGSSDPNTWPASGNPMSMVMGSIFWASQPVGTSVVPYDAPAMFRMTVLRAGIDSNTGGGVKWAAGPYAGGGWESGVLATMEQVGALIQPIRRSICNTLPSQSWITPVNATINSLSNGIVATRSPDDGTEFVHVLRPPAANTITLPAPADGRGYASASLLANGHPVALIRNADSSMTLTLTAGDSWDANDTVIALTPVGVTWKGNDGTLGAGTGIWSTAVDHFTGGAPVATRFRSGDNLDFSGAGAASVYFQNNGSVGDLSFSGKNYDIYPVDSPVLTLASGRINVSNGITATFNQNGSGGPLTINGAEGLQKTGDGTLVLNLPTAYTGSTILKGGTVSFASGGLGAGGNIVFQGGTLTYLAGNTDDISARIRHSQSPIAIDTGGNDVLFATPLGSDNLLGLTKLGAGTLRLAGGAQSWSGPVTVSGGTLKMDTGNSGVATIANNGFESPAYASTGWNYNPTNTGWTFSASSGTAANGAPWVNSAPEGVQAAFIQNSGSISGSITVDAAGSYVLSFQAANRPGYQSSGLVISLDNKTLLTLPPGQIGRFAKFHQFQCPAIALTVGTHSLVFQGIQNGADSGTIIDAVSLTGVGPGSLAAGMALQLTGSASTFISAAGSQTLSSLAGAAGSQILLTNTDLIISGNDPVAVFAGNLVGTGSVTVNGTLRLVGDAALTFTGPFVNNGILDIMTWNGTLPAGFVNNGIVLDRSAVKIDSFEKSGSSVSLTLTGYTGHTYQLQGSDDLSGTWENIGSAQPGTGAALLFTDPSGATGDHRFYRVVVRP